MVRYWYVYINFWCKCSFVGKIACELSKNPLERGEKSSMEIEYLEFWHKILNVSAAVIRVF